MAKNRRIPAYVHHKPTGQARVRINGKDHYLGKYGSPERRILRQTDPAVGHVHRTVAAFCC